jgi:2-polyprenyl-6-methoxyphenol hydroxylase-like FAD-dependent oxidoreductase
MKAVVIGGSVAGLLAAGAAARHFDQVTVLERDKLEDAPVSRKGAPQGKQIHVLLPIGKRMIGEIVPTISDDLIAANCDEFNMCREVVRFTRAGWQVRAELEMANIVAFRRPLLEWLIRRRIAALENVEVRHATAAGLVGDRGDVVTGVVLKTGETLAADLVIDAGGRGTKAPRWLSNLGFDPPEEEEVRVYIGYATQFVRVPRRLFKWGVKGISAGPWPGHEIGAVLLPADNGLHSLTALGVMKNYPPSNREAMLSFLEYASTPLIAEIARLSEPVSPVNVFHQPGNLLRHWERLDRRPGHFVATGDAVACFNPVYGQGMTAAALGATLLDKALSEPGATPDTVPAAFHESLSVGVGVAFRMAASGDALYHGAELRNFEPPTAEEVRLGKRLEQLATCDVEVAAAVLEAGLYLRPSAVATEEIKHKTEVPTKPLAERTVDPRDYPKTVHPPDDALAPAATAGAA